MVDKLEELTVQAAMTAPPGLLCSLGTIEGTVERNLPKRVVNRSERTTLRRISDFGDQHGCCVGGKPKTESDWKTCLSRGEKSYSAHLLKNRAPMNIPTDCEAVWRTVAATMMRAPMNTVSLRPTPSLMYGIIGRVAMEPMFWYRRQRREGGVASGKILTWMALRRPS